MRNPFHHARPRDALAGVPSLVLAVAHAVVLNGLLDRARWVGRPAHLLESWWACELVALLVTPILLWAFDPKETTPRWQRALTLPALLLLLGGISGLVRFLRAFWLYVLAKCAWLWLAPPTGKERLRGCFSMCIGLPLFVVLAAVFWNRPADSTFGLMNANQWSHAARVQCATILFGAVYFAAHGIGLSLLQCAVGSREDQIWPE